MLNFGAKIVHSHVLASKAPKQAVSGRKTGAEAAAGDIVERCEGKKVAGCPYGPRGEGFGAFWAAGAAVGRLYWIFERLY